MLIKEFCEATGLSRDAVRFYVKRGLLSPAIGACGAERASARRRNATSGRLLPPTNRYQVFDAAQVERASQIRVAQELGFTLAEISELASAYTSGRLTRTKKVAILRAHLDALDERARRLRVLRRFVADKLQWLEAGEVGPTPTTPAQLRKSAATAASPRR